jgi:hypothetical protein
MAVPVAPSLDLVDAAEVSLARSQCSSRFVAFVAFVATMEFIRCVLKAGNLVVLFFQ